MKAFCTGLRTSSPVELPRASSSADTPAGEPRAAALQRELDSERARIAELRGSLSTWRARATRVAGAKATVEGNMVRLFDAAKRRVDELEVTRHPHASNAIRPLTASVRARRCASDGSGCARSRVAARRRREAPRRIRRRRRPRAATTTAASRWRGATL